MESLMSALAKQPVQMQDALGGLWDYPGVGDEYPLLLRCLQYLPGFPCMLAEPRLLRIGLPMVWLNQ